VCVHYCALPTLHGQNAIVDKWSRYAQRFLPLPPLVLLAPAGRREGTLRPGRCSG
jgi:hypothetical protein